jgi:cation transport regulator
MAKTKTKKGSKNGRTKGGARSGTRKRKSKVDTALSSRTKKQIDSLPEHAQHIFKKAHASAVKQYQEPEKRRGGKSQSAEEVAHKAAWAAVKQKYKKQGGEWVSKE